MAYLITGALEGLEKIIDKNKSRMSNTALTLLESIGATIRATVSSSAKSLAALAIGGGILYFLKERPEWRKFQQLRRFAGLYGKQVREPAVFPVYVENRRTVENICTQIQNGPGVLVFWGPPDSGKTSYAIRTCNKLLLEKKIGGLVQINDSTFAEVEGDGGAQWINTALGVSDLMGRNEKMSSLLTPCNARSDSLGERCLSYVFQRSKRVVILFDQFDNVCEHSNLDAVLKFIKRLAEDSVKHNSYCVLLCVTNPSLAYEILKLNGGKKIRLLQRPRDLQWGDSELSEYFGRVPYTEAVRLAGTPGFCVDIFQQRITNEKQTSAKISKEWLDGDYLEIMMK
jgi:hypothetical protein